MDKSGEIELLIQGKENMTGAVTDGRPVIVDGKEGGKSVQIFTAIYESSRTGEIIHLF